MNYNEEVIIHCYNETKVMSREHAIAFYFECMSACEGSERDRYTNIYIGLIRGDKEVWDF